MSDAANRFLRRYLAFVGAAALCTAGVVCIGYWPTVRLASHQALWALVVGCGISWAASCIGAVPLARMSLARSSRVASTVMGATTLRFISVLLLVAPFLISGWPDRKVLALWVAVSYLLMLAVDTIFAVLMMKRVGENDLR